ncbi:MAG TPA: hypothetical protein VHB93_00400, partial [Candidatus Paceibacterota bacterium]|nr:hypothetical protein [Candidatus Paceibacterota bacterium]
MQSFNQYALLAKSFIDGHLYFTTAYQSSLGMWQDATPYAGHYYWPLGLLPALLLVPIEFAAMHFPISSPQGLLNVVFYCATLYAVYSLARNLGYRSSDSLWWTSAFSAGTMFLGVAAVSRSWNIAGTAATALVLLALSEYTGKKRYWLIGTYMALALLARSTVALGILFFLWDILSKSPTAKERVSRAISLLVPFAVGTALWLEYNFLRFGSFFDSGY